MTANLKQSSNNTGLALAREISPGVVDGTVSWLAQEPNTYKNFGGSIKTVARTPINPGRQNQKGVIVDLDASGQWQEDITYLGMQNKIEGLMFAAFRRKTELAPTGVETSDDAYLVASNAGIAAGDIIFGAGFTNPGNNGVKHVVTLATGKVEVSENLVDETGVTTGSIVKVGHTFTSGDITFTAATSTLASTTFDFTTLGLIVGEWMYCDDDTSGDSLGANLGFARVQSVAAHAIVFDKQVPIVATSAIIDAAGTGKTCRMYFGRVIKNEVGVLIQHYTYQAERSLGKDDTTATDFQAEYLHGSVIDTATFTFNTADKGTVEWGLVSAAYETRTSSQGLKAGTRPTLISGSAFNTSTDIKRIAMSLVGSSSPLYAYLLDFSIAVKNNAKPNKAIGVLGAIDITEGQYEVSGAATAYFANVAAAAAIQSNANVTVDVILCRENHGMIFDLPLISLGGGENKVTANDVIQLPLTVDAATAASLNPNANYTMLAMFFDYLPNKAM